MTCTQSAASFCPHQPLCWLTIPRWLTLHADEERRDERASRTVPRRTLFVGHLPAAATEGELRALFLPFGEVRSTRIVRDIVTGASCGYAFVEFYESCSCRRALQVPSLRLHDKRLLLEAQLARATPGWVPRRFGGGLGGRKESGQLRFGGRERPHRVPRAFLPTRRPVLALEHRQRERRSESTGRR